MTYPTVHEVPNARHDEWTEADKLAEEMAIEDALLCSIDLPKPPRLADVIEAVQSIGLLGRWSNA